MKKFLSALFCASVVLFASCSDDLDNADSNRDPVSLSINPSEVVAEGTAQSIEVALESNSGAFRVDASAQWVKPNITDKTMTLLFEENASGSERTAQVTVIAGFGDNIATETLAVTQKFVAVKPIDPTPEPEPEPEPEPTPTPGQHKVGDEYEGGIIIEITDTYIKVISKTAPQGENADTKISWTPSDLINAELPVNCTDKEDGRKNMEAIKKYENWATVCPVAKWCENMGEGWYWPASEELRKVFDNPELFKLTGMVADQYYWSSTEYDAKNAYCDKFKTEDQKSNEGHFGKKTARYVRAMKCIAK